MTRAGKLFAVAGALSMLAYRFANIDLAAFNHDEPLFLEAARRQLITGQWLSASPLVGNFGLHYGPAPVWFYGIIQLLFGDAARTSILAMGTMVILGGLALALALTNLLRGGAWMFAVLLAWIAASPYHFFWSRLAWDQLASVCSCWAVVILCGVERLRAGPALLLGLVLGIGLGAHPMILPFVLAVVAALAIEMRHSPRDLVKTTAFIGLGSLVVLAPYLQYLLRTPIRVKPIRDFSSAVWLQNLIEPARVGTLWGVQYYFGDDWGDFQAWLPHATSLLQARWVPLALSIGAALLGIAASLASRVRRRYRIAMVAALVWIVAPLLFAMSGIGQHPHYQFATWWVVPFGISSAIAWIRERNRVWGAVALAAIAGIAVFHFLFIVQWMQYTRERGGTRGIYYPTPIGLQEVSVREICGHPGAVLEVRNEAFPWSHSLSYLSSTEPACRGKRIVFCGPDPCPSLEGASRLRLRYAKPHSGRLLVEAIPP